MMLPKKAAYDNICKTIHSRLNGVQDYWLSENADEIQSLTEIKGMNKFYDAQQKTFYGPKSSETTKLLRADGRTRLTNYYDTDNDGKMWLSSQVHSNGTANFMIASACTGPEWWRVLRTVANKKWKVKR